MAPLGPPVLSPTPMSTRSAKNNLQSAVAHSTMVDDYIHHELSLERISGPTYLLCFQMCILTDLGSSPRTISTISGK